MVQMDRIMLDEVVDAAINAATLAAIQKARQTGTNVLVWENGKMVPITSDDSEAQFYQDAGVSDQK